MKINFEIDLEKFRYSLIGDGYTKEEALAFSDEELINILKFRIDSYIQTEYNRGLRMGLYH